jgi:hypothetical protein
VRQQRDDRARAFRFGQSDGRGADDREGSDDIDALDVSEIIDRIVVWE